MTDHLKLVAMAALVSAAFGACRGQNPAPIGQVGAGVPITGGSGVGALPASMEQPVATASAGSSAIGSGTAVTPGIAGAPAAPMGVAGVNAPAVGSQAGIGVQAAAGMAGSALAGMGATPAAHGDHCVHGYEPQPTD